MKSSTSDLGLGKRERSFHELAAGVILSKFL